MDDQSEIYNLWRIRKTILQICHDRGYLVTEDELDQTLEQFKDTFGDKPSENKPARSHLNILAAHNDDPTNILFVQFSDDPKVGVQQLRSFYQRTEDEKATNTILVLRNNLKAPSVDFLKYLSDEKKINFEVFLEDELLVNIVEHSLVPPHSVLTPDEKNELLQRYRVKESQLPRIQAADPVARYFGLKRGQVVRIIRKSETAGRYITYRLVT